MKRAKNVVDKVIDFIEESIPGFLLCIVVIGFTTNIIYRYVALSSIPQLDEIVIICFTWMALFAAPKGLKTDGHVSFTLLYDAVSPKAKRVMDVVGCALLIVCLFILLKPSMETVQFYSMRKTPIIYLPFNYLYAPFILFLVLCIYHLIEKLCVYIKTYFSAKTDGGH